MTERDADANLERNSQSLEEPPTKATRVRTPSWQHLPSHWIAGLPTEISAPTLCQVGNGKAKKS